MSYIIEGILDRNEINDYNIINTIDICSYINVYENNIICNNVNNKRNIITNNNVNFIGNTELLSVSIKLEDKIVKKLYNKNNYIYIINFIYIIEIKLCINSKFTEVEFKDMQSISISYKDIEICDIDIHPINLELRNLDDKFYFGLNCIVIDKSVELIQENFIETKTEINENINNKHYSYIDINEEFI